MRAFVGTLAGMVLPVMLLVVGTWTTMTLLDAGDYLLAALGSGLTLGLLATSMVATLLSTVGR